MKRKEKTPEIFICNCHSTDHQIVFLFSEEDLGGYIDKTCYMHIHLNKRPFWERLKYGIKYILGHKSRFGAFDEFILNPDDSDRLQSVVDYLKKTENV